MTFDLRRRLREPAADEERPRLGGTDEEFDSWFDRYQGVVLAPEVGDAWLNFPNSLAWLLIDVLYEAGAVWGSEREQCCNPRLPCCRHLERARDGRVSVLKFASNEGWFVTGEEAVFVADCLDCYLKREPVIEVQTLDVEAYRLNPSDDNPPLVTRSYHLAIGSPDAELLVAFREISTFCRGSTRFGFEVW